MSYRVLGESLWPTAEAVRRYLRQQHGLAALRIEEELAPGIPRPTLHAKAADQTYICADFYEDTCFSSLAELFVSACKVRQLPVRMYVGFPEGGVRASFERDLRDAQAHGVGVLSVAANGTVTVLADALSLVLADVRRVELKDFPAKYRANLSLAERTYRQGNPSKGCAEVYEILEGLTRKLAKELHSRGLIPAWQKTAPRFDRDAWYSLAKAIYVGFDFASHLPSLSPAQWAQVIAITRPRNDSNHPPKNVSDRVRRDRELRTRFETATDLLRDLLVALKPLKLK